MNLYGDWANAAVLVRELEARGHSVVLDKKSVGDDIDFDSCDLVYIGSGTERSQRECLRNISKHKDALFAKINDGMHVLATGNSHEMFGRWIRKTDGEAYEALGLLDFETMQENSRVTGDCVCKATFLEEKLVGFINRAGGGQKGSVERPFHLEFGQGLSDDSRAEGVKFKNFLGTYMTGPILVRNPPLLMHIADAISVHYVDDCRQGQEAGDIRPCSDGISDGAARSRPDPLFGYLEKAYKSALSELSLRSSL